MTQNPNLAALSSAGVSVWLDDLSRQRLQSGNLQELIDTKSVVGVTTNPSIFQKALARRRCLRRPGRRARRARRRRGRHDPHRHHRRRPQRVRRAAGRNGSPPTASTAGCRSRSTRGWRTTPTRPSPRPSSCGRSSTGPNLLIKIPATKDGLPAITAVLAEGISVNVTLIFSVERHREVMDAYLAGLEAAKAAGHDVSKIHSVASFFVSRVDTESTSDWRRSARMKRWHLRGQAGVANARLAYAAYQEVFVGGERFAALERDGARVQRPLWASTGVKNPDYSDTLYVTELVAPNTVNTMPENDDRRGRRPRDRHRRHGHRHRVGRPGGVRQARRDRHRPDRRVPSAGERRRREVRGLLERAAGRDAGSASDPPAK